MMLVKQECEDILKATRETTEKQFQEIVDMYNETKKQLTRLEEQIGTYQSCEREHENRTFELANLLETLKRFDVNVGSVCQLAAEALRNLTERGNLFEESMKNLRHLAWTVKDRKDEPQLDLLREQNSVLKQVIRNLKRKFQMHQETRDDIPERETERQHAPSKSQAKSNSDTIPSNETIITEGDTSVAKNTMIPINYEDNNNFLATRDEERVENVTHGLTGAHKNDNRSSTALDIERKLIDRCERVLCIESHLNGVLYEEYVFKLSFNREIKMKCPVLLTKGEESIRMEFVDDEDDYEKPPSDRMLILFKNVHAVVNVKQTGISCGTQTTRTKAFSSFTQTALTGINSFSRLNVGVTMLNSEKRAIERSLCNLERTVQALKANALNQAETMINKDSYLLGNEKMLDCIKELTGQHCA